MSAYVCPPEHFGILGAYAAQGLAVVSSIAAGSRVEAAQNVARLLAAENIRSVAHRYPEDVSGSRPGAALEDDEIIEAAAIYAGHFVKHGVTPTPIEVLKLCAGYEYQSCETRNWKDTIACLQLSFIMARAINSLQGYDEAAWAYSREVPEVVALYVKS